MVLALELIITHARMLTMFADRGADELALYVHHVRITQQSHDIFSEALFSSLALLKSFGQEVTNGIWPRCSAWEGKVLHAVEGLYEVCCQGRDLRHERLSGRKRRLYGVLAPHKISEGQIYTCVCSYTDDYSTMHINVHVA